jgi:hypothetical protein
MVGFLDNMQSDQKQWFARLAILSKNTASPNTGQSCAMRTLPGLQSAPLAPQGFPA